MNTRLLPALVGLLAVVQVLAPYTGWRILLVTLGGAWLTGYLWARALARGLALQREMRFGWAQVGDLLEERFTLTNRSLVAALWVEVEDHTTMPGYRASLVTGVGSRSQRQWRTQGACTQRGLFTHGPTTLRSGDPLGIYTVELHDPRAADLLVTPPIVPLPPIEVVAGRRTGEGRPRPDALDRTAAAGTVRKHQPGESLRRVHWPTSARREELYVRLLEGAPAGDWWILLDLNRQVQAGQGSGSTLEQAIILAASLADRGLRQGKPVGLALNSEPLAWLPPRPGDAQRWQILHRLALAEPGNRPLAELLAPRRAAFGRGASLVLITPDTGGEWLAGLLHLAWSGTAPTVLLLDPASFEDGALPEVQAGSPAARLAQELAAHGIRREMLTRAALDRPEAHPGRQGRSEYRITPSGRAVRVGQPPEQTWHRLE